MKKIVEMKREEGELKEMEVEEVMNEEGIGEFIERMKDEDEGNQKWDMVIQGGKKKKVMIERIMIKKKYIILMEEEKGEIDKD